MGPLLYLLWQAGAFADSEHDGAVLENNLSSRWVDTGHCTYEESALEILFLPQTAREIVTPKSPQIRQCGRLLGGAVARVLSFRKA